MLVSYFQRSYVFMLVICFRFNFESSLISCNKVHEKKSRIDTEARYNTTFAK
jgi:hypothetical protein